jgi:hypothetical protein
MLRATHILTILVLLASGAASHAQTAEWSAVDSKGGRFAASLPGPPVLTTKNDSTPVGGIIEHIYTVTQGNETFTINYQDLPEMAVLFGGAGRIFNGARDGYLKDNNGTQSAYERLKLDNHNGWQLLYTSPAQDDRPAMQGRVEFFLVGRRLYVVAASWPQSGTSADSDRFFESFAITK